SGPDEHWSRIFSIRRDVCDACGAAVYPLSVCRACGQVYVQMYRASHERTYLSEAADPMADIEKYYFTWKPFHEKDELFEELDELEEVADTEESTPVSQEKRILCLHCRHEQEHCSCEQPVLVTLYLVSEVEKGKHGSRLKPVSHMNQCGRCHSR